MSVRGLSHETSHNEVIARLIFAVATLTACFLLVALPTAAQTQNTASVRIEAANTAVIGQKMTVSVVLTDVGPDFEARGFELAIDHDSRLKLHGTPDPGRLLWDIGWQREVISYQDGVLKIAGGPSLGSPHLLTEPGEIMRLTFGIPNDIALAGQSLPINFIWTDCSDNGFGWNEYVWHGDNDDLFVSTNVYDWQGTPIAGNESFPTAAGVPDSCLSAITAVRALDFYAGHIELSPDTPVVHEEFAARVLVDRVLAGLDSVVSVDVHLTQIGLDFETGGFDLLLQYDGRAELLGVDRGHLLGDHFWDYFTYRADTIEGSGSANPDGLIRIVAMADTSGDGGVSSLIDEPGAIATLTFHVPMDSAVACQFLRIRNVWHDCSDNVFDLHGGGDTLLMSNRVLNDEGWLDVTQNGAFPTELGAPIECSAEPSILKAINFQGGHVDVQCIQDLDERGDVNVNGITYEVSDAVLLANYFVYGLSVFSTDMADQTTNTDVNCNGVPLELADLVWMSRAICGEVEPFPEDGPDSLVGSTQADSALFVQDKTAKTVSLDYSDSLHSFCMTFAGDVTPTSLGGHFDGVRTRVSLSGFGPVSDTVFKADPFLTYEGEGTLLSADVNLDGLTIIPTVVQVDVATDCCVISGDINYDGMGPNIGDLVYLINHMFAVGPAPPCAAAADVEGDSEGAGIDLSNLVYLVRFMFAGGPAPVPCP